MTAVIALVILIALGCIATVWSLAWLAAYVVFHLILGVMRILGWLGLK